MFQITLFYYFDKIQFKVLDNLLLKNIWFIKYLFGFFYNILIKYIH